MSTELQPEFLDEKVKEEEQEEEARPPESILYKRPQRKDFFIVALLVLLCFLFSMLYWQTDYKNYLWVSKNSIFNNHDYWRLFTALLAHADIKHFLSNMGLFAIFGWLLRSYFGLLAFPISAFLVGALTNLITIYFYPDNLKLIGASGIVYALVAMWITFYIKYEARYSFGQKLFRVLGFSLVLLLPTSYSPNVSYLAHGVGFLLGILCALILILTQRYDAVLHKEPIVEPKSAALDD